jgi:hypothetical protein
MQILASSLAALCLLKGLWSTAIPANVPRNGVPAVIAEGNHYHLASILRLAIELAVLLTSGFYYFQPTLNHPFASPSISLVLDHGSPGR